jgi:hypothetical protein
VSPTAAPLRLVLAFLTLSAVAGRSRPAALGEWVEGDSLRFKVEAVVKASKGSGAPALLAFVVRIVAGRGEIFISPRDISLEAGGVILQTKVSPEAVAAGGSPALTAQRLAAGHSLRGSVIFAVSPEFRASTAPMILAYRPTRWGGAGRLEVRIPNCLEACKERGQ